MTKSARVAKCRTGLALGHWGGLGHPAEDSETALSPLFKPSKKKAPKARARVRCLLLVVTAIGADTFLFTLTSKPYKT